MLHPTSADICIICGYAIRWHFEDGYKLECSEVRIRLTGKLPRWNGCADAMEWFEAEEKRHEENPIPTR